MSDTDKPKVKHFWIGHWDDEKSKAAHPFGYRPPHHKGLVLWTVPESADVPQNCPDCGAPFFCLGECQ